MPRDETNSSGKFNWNIAEVLVSIDIEGRC